VLEYIENWCEDYTIDNRLTPQVASLIFSSISHEEKMAFFKAWMAMNIAGDFLAYDVTSFSTYAKKIEESGWGYNRDGEKLPQINMGYYLSSQTGLPLFYVTYAGSIIDKSYMPYMMVYNNELKVKDAIFVMNRGFCSTANIQWLHSKNIRYVMTVDSFRKATCSAIDEVRDTIKSVNNFIRPGLFGQTIHSRFYGVRADVHIFYSHELEVNHEASLFRRVEVIGEKLRQLKKITPKEAKFYSNYYIININNDGTFTYTLNGKNIDSKRLNNGFYSIISNTKFDIKNIDIIYKRRDKIEKGFDDIKNFIDMKRMRTHNDLTTRGKLFCAFISMIAVSQITEKLRSINKVGGHRRWSKDGFISELEKIKLFTFSDGSVHLMNPLTKTQRELFATFGTDEDALKTWAKCSYE
jgi:transposase